MKTNIWVKDCGTILKKTAKGEEYAWGVRFYKLLTECFQAWAIMDEKGEIGQSFEELKAAGVPLMEDNVYYEADASKLPQQHQTLDKLLQSEDRQGNEDMNKVGMMTGGLSRPGQVLNNPYESDIYISPQVQKPNPLASTNRINDVYYDPTARNPPKKSANPLFEELKQLKQDYLDALFADRPDASRIMESQVCFQSFFESQREELSRALFGETYGQISDKETDTLVREIEFASNLQDLFDKENANYGNKADLSRVQKKVLELYKVAYGEVPFKYKKTADAKNPLVAEKSKYEAPTANSKPYKDDYHYGGYDPVKPDPYKKKDNSLDLDIDTKPYATGEETPQRFEDENKKLKMRQDRLKREIEELRRRERQLMSVGDKTESFRGEADPQLLIEEFHKKNKEYEMLRGKYKALVQELNDKAYSDYSNVKSEKEIIQRSIGNSFNKLESRQYNSGRRSYVPQNKSPIESYSSRYRAPNTETLYMPKSSYLRTDVQPRSVYVQPEPTYERVTYTVPDPVYTKSSYVRPDPVYLSKSSYPRTDDVIITKNSYPRAENVYMPKTTYRTYYN